MGVIFLSISLFFLAIGFNWLISETTRFLEVILFSFSGGRDVSILILSDYTSLLFVGVVRFISSIVLFYRGDYMELDRNFYRFVLTVCLFVLSIFLIVIRPNMIRILIGWDGLGLVSYCLIIFYQNEKSARSGILTVLRNRIGDIAILLTIRWIRGFGRWNFTILIELFPEDSRIIWILALVIIAAITKSAQIPFSAWLPAAIAAPTPVSALVHSSTLVTAGVYLLIRFSPLLGCSKFLFFVSLLTIFISGVGACLEQDAKKIVALSTLRQLGVIIFSLSLGLRVMALFHLLTHALFKSLLFICMGLYIHGSIDQQDLRGIGQQRYSMPLTSCYFLASSLALRGFFFIAGFYSKDLILEMFDYQLLGVFSLLMVLITVAITVTYRIRLLFFLYGQELGKKLVSRKFGERNLANFSIIPLFILSVVGGSRLYWALAPIKLVILQPEFRFIVVLVVIRTAAALFFIWILKSKNSVATHTHTYLVSWGTIWYTHDLFTLTLINFYGLRERFLGRVDQGWLEYLGIRGVRKKSLKISGWLDLGVEVGVVTHLFGGFILILLILALQFRYSLKRAKEWRFLGEKFYLKVLGINISTLKK
jgi:NADH-ubiquinone oxidoreductase chain 5